MIIWRTNFQLDEEFLNATIENVKVDQNKTDEGYYTTYFTQNLGKRAEIVFVDQYRDAVAGAMKHVGLYHRCDYVFDHWMQVYPGHDDGHPQHDHYFSEGLISWVHFVKPSSIDRFYFLDSYGNRTYPKQDEGDFIVFNTWQLHGVDGCDEEYDRVVVAGNVYAKNVYSPDQNGKVLLAAHTPMDNRAVKCEYSSVNGTLEWVEKEL